MARILFLAITLALIFGMSEDGTGVWPGPGEMTEHCASVDPNGGACGETGSN